MKTVSKKLLSLLLVAILLVSALPFQAFAEEPVEDTSVVIPEATEETTATEAAPAPEAAPVPEAAPAPEAAPVAEAAPEFQADTPLEHTDSHTLSGLQTDGSKHWQECTVANCARAGEHINETACDFTSGKCACGTLCPHATKAVDPDTVKAATCQAKGYSGDEKCTICGAVTKTGDETAIADHTYGADNVCTVCGTKKPAAETEITLDANGGQVGGGKSMIIGVKSNVPELPTPVRTGFKFVGWYTDADVRVNSGSTYDGSYTKLIAKWAQNTEVLTVRRVKNGDNSTAETLLVENVPTGTPLLDYLKQNVTPVVDAALKLTPGYSWQYNFWKDFSGSQPLTDQTTCMNQAQTVFVNFVANPYTLYFNANGGEVTPVSKTVYFDSKVGVLPTPVKAGKVFQGWRDDNNVIYTADTVYKVAGDTSLTAVWSDEALVILYIYINGDFSSCNRMVVLDGFVQNKNISRSDVVNEVAKYYTPASGYLNIAGLFDEYSWGSYKANTAKPGVENIQISDAHPNKIFVMVTNAKTGTTVVNGTTGTGNNGTTMVNGPTQGNGNPVGAYWVSTGNGSGYWVYPAANGNGTNPTYIYNGTNPKTGDNAMLEIAAAVMVLAAGALVTIMTLRKKRMI